MNAETNKVESADGRYYFKYGIGTVFQCFHRNFGGASGDPTIVLKIIGCRMLDDETEFYEVILNDSETSVKEFSSEELEILLEAGGAVEIESGTAQELPIREPLVKWYFSAMKRKRKLAKEAAEKELNGEMDIDPKTKKQKTDKNGNLLWIGGDANYREAIKNQDQIARLLASEIAQGSENLKSYTDQYGKICARRKEIIERHGIDLRLFLPDEICPNCNGTGIRPNGRICVCAYEKEDEIKTFAAIQKMSKRLMNEWLTPFYDADDQTGEGTEPQEQLEGIKEHLIEGEKESS